MRHEGERWRGSAAVVKLVDAEVALRAAMTRTWPARGEALCGTLPFARLLGVSLQGEDGADAGPLRQSVMDTFEDEAVSC